MLLPDNIRPELCFYYNGGIILGEIDKHDDQSIFELYHNVKKKNDISFSVFLLSLDWLYLIRAAEFDERGVIKRCS